MHVKSLCPNLAHMLPLNEKHAEATHANILKSCSESDVFFKSDSRKAQFLVVWRLFVHLVPVQCKGFFNPIHIFANCCSAVPPEIECWLVSMLPQEIHLSSILSHPDHLAKFFYCFVAKKFTEDELLAQ